MKIISFLVGTVKTSFSFKIFMIIIQTYITNNLQFIVFQKKIIISIIY